MVQAAMPSVYSLTYQDWLGFPDDGRRYELIDGELFVSPPPNIRHQRISRELEFSLLTFLRANGLGEILDAPVGVQLRDELVLEPDLVVVLEQHAHRIGEQAIVGPPDLVVDPLPWDCPSGSGGETAGL